MEINCKSVCTQLPSVCQFHIVGVLSASALPPCGVSTPCRKAMETATVCSTNRLWNAASPCNLIHPMDPRGLQSLHLSQLAHNSSNHTSLLQSARMSPLLLLCLSQYPRSLCLHPLCQLLLQDLLPLLQLVLRLHAQQTTTPGDPWPLVVHCSARLNDL